jgi:hypothetical protein
VAATARWEYHCSPMQKEGMRMAGERGWEMVGVYAVAPSTTTEAMAVRSEWRLTSRHNTTVTYCFKRPLP